MSKWNTRAKDKIRRDMFEISRQFAQHTKRHKVYSCAMMVPAEDCLCIKAALKEGIIDTDTYIVAIEVDTITCQKIRETLRGLGFKNFRIINKFFSKISVEDFKLVPPCDFVYLDLCGIYTANVYRTISYLKFHGAIDKDAPIALTAMLTDRTNFWNTEEPPTVDYKFSNIPKTLENAQQLASMLVQNIGDEYGVTYGRSYKNSIDAAPMLTLLCQKKVIKKVKKSNKLHIQQVAEISESGCPKTYDMNYKK
jgi:hypothetical protein